MGKCTHWRNRFHHGPRHSEPLPGAWCRPAPVFGLPGPGGLCGALPEQPGGAK